MVFKRKVYDKLLEWKKLSAGASAVLLEGARRIGKSTIVEEFAKNEYDDYMILDFAREGKDIRENFIENMDHLDVFFLAYIHARLEFHVELLAATYFRRGLRK